MDAFTYSTFLAVLALTALALAVAGTVVGLAGSPQTRAGVAGGARWLAWAVAAVAAAGSLLYSEYFGLEPCRLCWFQRIAMYPLAVVLLVGALRRDRAVWMYGLPMAVVGLGISIWHYTIQLFPGLEGGSCDPTNPCTARQVEIFGFISIPFMAGAGFLLITVLLAFFAGAGVPSSEAE